MPRLPRTLPVVLLLAAAIAAAPARLGGQSAPSRGPAPAQPATPTPPPSPDPAPAPQPDSPQTPGRGEPPASPSRGPAPRQPAGDRGDPGDGEAALPGSVRNAMSIMNRNLRTLRKQVTDPTKKDDNLQLVSEMERGCLGAKALIPPGVTARIKDEARKAEVVATYRKQLVQMMQKLLTLESDLLDGKADDAQKDLDAVIQLRDASHELMGPGEGGGGRGRGR